MPVNLRAFIYAVTALATLVLPAGAADTIAHRHMIAAANPLAAEAGREMMREGGSAVDAAIATQLVLTLVEPESSGIGGGAFMMLYDPRTRQVLSYDGRETAPASATPGMFLDAMEFWNEQSGIVIGDPIKGRFFITRSFDNGDHWQDIPFEIGRAHV